MTEPSEENFRPTARAVGRAAWDRSRLLSRAKRDQRTLAFNSAATGPRVPNGDRTRASCASRLPAIAWGRCRPRLVTGPVFGGG